MEQGYLLDSNIIIGYLAGRISPSGMEIVSAIIDQTPHISVISQIEVLRFNFKSLGKLTEVCGEERASRIIVFCDDAN